jgi:hypothetical protein
MTEQKKGGRPYAKLSRNDNNLRWITKLLTILKLLPPTYHGSYTVFITDGRIQKVERKSWIQEEDETA